MDSTQSHLEGFPGGNLAFAAQCCGECVEAVAVSVMLHKKSQGALSAFRPGSVA